GIEHLDIAEAGAPLVGDGVQVSLDRSGDDRTRAIPQLEEGGDAQAAGLAGLGRPDDADAGAFLGGHETAADTAEDDPPRGGPLDGESSEVPPFGEPGGSFHAKAVCDPRRPEQSPHHRTKGNGGGDDDELGEPVEPGAGEASPE